MRLGKEYGNDMNNESTNVRLLWFFVLQVLLQLVMCSNWGALRDIGEDGAEVDEAVRGWLGPPHNGRAEGEGAVSQRQAEAGAPYLLDSPADLAVGPILGRVLGCDFGALSYSGEPEHHLPGPPIAWLHAQSGTWPILTRLGAPVRHMKCAPHLSSASAAKPTLSGGCIGGWFVLWIQSIRRQTVSPSVGKVSIATP